MTGEKPAVHEALAVYAPEITETERVPEGYRHTEVGVIPEDWESVAIGSIAKFTSGMLINASTLHRQSPQFSIPVFGGNGIAGYTNDNIALVPTVVIGRVGQKCGSVYRTDGPAWITDNALYPKQIYRSIDVGFLALALEGARLNEVRNRNDLPLITQSIVHNVQIALPRGITEQRAIAAALSDVDALISALDELIAKKRAVKTAAMQQLLTGKQRLPGFSWEWEVRRLGDVGTFSKGSGLAKSDLSPSGKLPAIPYTAIYTDLDEVIEFSKLVNFTNPSSGARIINSPHLLIAGSSNMLENIGKVTAFKEHTETVIGGDIILYKTSDDVSFLSYLLNTRLHRELIMSLSQGSTIRHVYAATFRDYEVSLPPVEEQTAIAAVLSDMDAEIEALEARREKTRQVKRGTMQELLTGRTRLV